ncbi:hypothetical protein B0T11DRAFT_323565 [Plectosphaerella cucumerina]|uniref:Uncharacterized protein n=1 Tax=Plectosphaerella cucumerina TaxID=40658 RepID=A0A8K0X8N5_9PEZI|nr:hypothetical protein B0T11DRAFT_323565 [Plectosphaerella cucumerina]
MKTSVVLATLLAGLALASPLGETERREDAAQMSRIEKRCHYENCNDCYRNAPPDDVRNKGASLGHFVYCAAFCC